MASAAVKNNPLKESSNKFSSSTSEKRAKKAVAKPAKAGKAPGSSNRSSSGSSRSGKNKKKAGSKPRSKESASKRSNRDKSKSGSKRKSGSSGNSAARKKKSSASKSKSGKKLNRSETIKLSCGADVYYVSARSFAACSNLIKKELAVNAHARSVDLRQFDKTTVRVLAEYIESKKIKTDVSFYSLAELLKFSKVFEMDNLRSQLEKFITLIAYNDMATLHQVLLIIGITAVTRATERVILERAARSFTELAAQNTFQRIPFNVVVSLFARCDLNVKNEVQVVDAMLLWCAGQPNLPLVVPSLFYLVRHDFIHAVQKAFIIERARALRFPDDVVMAIDRCFECRNGTRICVLREHYEAKFARCGIADASVLDAKNPDMPLSIPREAIIYKPTEADTVPANNKSAARNFHSSEARPYYHGPPACSGRSKKSHSKKTGSSSARKSKSKRGAARKSKSSKNQQSSSRSKSKSGSRKSSRSKKENKKTVSKGKKSSSSSARGKAAKAPPVTH